MAAYDFVKNTSQKNPLIGKDMVKNLAGAYAFKADDFTALDRWLLTGSSTNAFYQKKEEMTADNIKILISAAKADAKKVASKILYASVHGISVSTPIFALAVLSSVDTTEAKKAFKEIFNSVIRTASHLYEFLEYNKNIRGFGKIIRSAVNSWFAEGGDLEYQFLKYQSRSGWAHKDVLRKFHITPSTDAMNSLFKWAVKGWDTLSPSEKDKLDKIKWFEYIKENKDEASVIFAIKEGNLTWEMVIGNVQNITTTIWKELFMCMPVTATIRYLATLTANGVFKDIAMLNILENRLTDESKLTKAKVHPLSLAKALSIYTSGGKASEHSKLRYTPIPRVIDILNKAIETSFKTINPTNKKILISVDVSGSMWGGSAYGSLAPAQVAGLIALSFAKSEKNYFVGKFDTIYSPMNITKSTSFQQVIDKKSGIWPKDFGGTDASLAYTYALKNKEVYDAFINITDNESWSGDHPVSALKNYRNKINKNAKAIYISLIPYGDRTSLVDTSDKNSYDIGGFSDETVKIIQMILEDRF